MSLKTNFLGFDVANPLMPAPGPPVRDAKACIDCIKGGTGVMVTKTISVVAAPVPLPNMYEHQVHKYFLNTELWSELSPEQWFQYEFPKIREECTKAKIPMVVSMGYTAEEIAKLAPQAAQFADAFELSTHYIADDPKPMQDAVRAALEGGGGKPVIVKLSPFRDAYIAANAAKAAGASALTISNSFGPCVAFDIERRGAPLMGSSSKYGWMSGPAVKPISMRAVFDVAQKCDLPIIGVGGITNGKDAIEYLMAGASYLGICTAAIVQGRDCFGTIAAEMEDWMSSHGYSSVQELIGLGVKHAQLSQHKPPKVDPAKCIGCEACVTSCCFDALTMCDEGVAVCEDDRCYKCGLCYTRCPVDAIAIVG